MSAEDMIADASGALAVGGQGSDEAGGASALATTSATTADAPTTGRPLFEPLHKAKQSLGDQSEVSARMHPLNTSLQSLYAASSSDGRLSRDQYRQLISQIRHSVSQFAATSPALRPQPSTSSTSPAQQADDAGTANHLRRYISLLTETSTHTAALAHSIAPIKSTDRVRSDAGAQRDASPPFPLQLRAGVFRTGSSQKPTLSWEDALHTLGALCETLESTAKTLGLETFSEPSAEATAAPNDADSIGVLTHTLTLGAKILVIDVEFLIFRHSRLGLRPRCKLKLSYATDSADSQQSRDPRLGAILERDVQQIADKLFGPVVSSALQQDRSLVAQALSDWTSNLTELLNLDDLEARASETALEGSRRTDLFAAMQEFCSDAVRISDAEASSSSPAALLDRGHGLHKLHETKPFLQSVFARDPTSNQEYSLSLGVEALDLPVADHPHARDTTPSFPLSRTAEDLLASSSSPDPARSLGSVPSLTDSKKRVPLHFVVRLSPPVVVTRPTAAKLASICNFSGSTPHNSTASALGVAPAGATWFEDVLASSWSRRPQQSVDDTRKSTRCTFTLAQTVESVRSTESQGLVIDSLPLLCASTSSPDAMDESDEPKGKASTLARFFGAIQVLRDEVKVTELMHSSIASSEKNGSANADLTDAEELTLEDVLTSTPVQSSSKISVILAFRTPIDGANDEARQALSLELAFRVPAETGATVVFDATISPSKCTSEIGWSLSAEAKSAPLQDPSSKTARLDRSSSEAQSIVSKLSDLESLEDVVLGLVDWAEKDLGVRLQKPEAAQPNPATFNPLSYEQQNVHAIYETIAPHFSSTRYKPWPLIPAFLSTIPAGSLGADLGCGNGKYLPIRSTLSLARSAITEQELAQAAKSQNSLLTVGVDRSSNLIGLARDNFGMLDAGDTSKTQVTGEQGVRRQEVAVGDAIQSSLRTGLFDYAISIATIHHFSTWERRRASVQELIRIVAPVDSNAVGGSDVGEASLDSRLEGGRGRGRFMIFVWALEQKNEGKRQFQAQDPEMLKSAPEIHDPNHVKSKDRLVSYSGLQAAGHPVEADTKVTDDQDVLVPWVLTTASKKPKMPRMAKGKRGQATKQVDTREIEAGISGMNVVPQSEETKGVGESRPVYNRYYHMFRAGELESLVADAAASMPVVHFRGGATRAEKVDIVREASGWERGNWWGVWRVQWSQ